jgi:hypothetical protein
MDVKTAIRNGDTEALRALLREDASLANALIRWGRNDEILTHPLHFVSDMLFESTLPRGKELPLVNALIEAGADIDFQRVRQDGIPADTPLIGAASLGAEEVGVRLVEVGAKPEVRGLFGATALHWASLLGLDRLVAALIPGSDVNLKDERYKSSSLGWAVHGWTSPPRGNLGRQAEAASLLIAAGAVVQPDLIEAVRKRGESPMLRALVAGTPPLPGE